MQKLYALVFVFIIFSSFSAQTPDPVKSTTTTAAQTGPPAGTNGSASGNSTRDYLKDLPEEKNTR